MTSSGARQLYTRVIIITLVNPGTFTLSVDAEEITLKVMFTFKQVKPSPLNQQLNRLFTNKDKRCDVKGTIHLPSESIMNAVPTFDIFSEEFRNLINERGFELKVNKTGGNIIVFTTKEAKRVKYVVKIKSNMKDSDVIDGIFYLLLTINTETSPELTIMIDSSLNIIARVIRQLRLGNSKIYHKLFSTTAPNGKKVRAIL